MVYVGASLSASMGKESEIGDVLLSHIVDHCAVVVPPPRIQNLRRWCPSPSYGKISLRIVI